MLNLFVSHVQMQFFYVNRNISEHVIQSSYKMSRLLSSLRLEHKIFLAFSWLIEKVIDASFDWPVIKYRLRYYGLIDRKSSRSNARRTRKNVSMKIALLIKSSFPSNNFFFFFFSTYIGTRYIKHVILGKKRKKGLNHAMNLQRFTILIFTF